MVHGSWMINNLSPPHFASPLMLHKTRGLKHNGSRQAGLIPRRGGMSEVFHKYFTKQFNPSPICILNTQIIVGDPAKSCVRYLSCLAGYWLFPKRILKIFFPNLIRQQCSDLLIKTRCPNPHSNRFFGPFGSKHMIVHFLVYFLHSRVTLSL